jgi:hypothetical protein
MKPLKPNKEKLPEKNEWFSEKILLFAVQSSILERMDGASIACDAEKVHEGSFC